MNLFKISYFASSHQFKGWKLISGNIEESSEDGTLADRKTSFSKIKLRPNSADNQATYACEVEIGPNRIYKIFFPLFPILYINIFIWTRLSV